MHFGFSFSLLNLCCPLLKYFQVEVSSFLPMSVFFKLRFLSLFSKVFLDFLVRLEYLMSLFVLGRPVLLYEGHFDFGSFIVTFEVFVAVVGWPISIIFHPFYLVNHYYDQPCIYAIASYFVEVYCLKPSAFGCHFHCSSNDCWS